MSDKNVVKDCFGRSFAAFAQFKLKVDFVCIGKNTVESVVIAGGTVCQTVDGKRPGTAFIRSEKVNTNP